MFSPICKSEYREGIVECPDCRCRLSASLPETGQRKHNKNILLQVIARATKSVTLLATITSLLLFFAFVLLVALVPSTASALLLPGALVLNVVAAENANILQDRTDVIVWSLILEFVAVWVITLILFRWHRNRKMKRQEA